MRKNWDVLELRKSKREYSKMESIDNGIEERLSKEKRSKCGLKLS